MRVIVIRAGSLTQDLSNQSVRRLSDDEFRVTSVLLSLSFFLLIRLRFSARVVYSHPLERSRQLPREFDDTVIDRNSIAESRPWKIEVSAPSGTEPSSCTRANRRPPKLQLHCPICPMLHESSICLKCNLTL